MREILFRGRADTNYYPHIDQWVYGSYVHQTQFYGDPVDHHWIVYNGEFDCDYYDAVRIIAKTIGQYTGFKDKNGKKIFEGDILKCTLCGEHRSVVFDEHYGEFEFDSRDPVENPDGSCLCCDHDVYEIVGNIHDNPELLGG